ncbi:type II toxin-antitoxin system ParD family antitoxin [Acidisoma silvae]|uniref:Type II toxin-antitoxin system ParD family antitoxin n=1 Tax=Acidisoma silvae TaxID=2802396 RepID=A0A964E037_9PROT|nr:type II toxin-antitoxin system ParD family antitoxin [Acidisoma silvae]MCB8876752.1 type II toxin-antitoxin system ParD family antitoxin [Acidisoma silvae]
MAIMNVSLPDPLRNWVQERIDAGDYASASDYVQDLIQRDRTEAEQHETMIAMLEAAEKSGVSPRSVQDIFESVVEKMAGRESA